MRGQSREHPSDRAISELARQQHGVVGRAQLKALGLGDDAIDWREQRLIVETDGAAAHGGERRRARDLGRDAELAAEGWRVIRITYERLVREPERVAEQLGRALTPSRRPAAHGARRLS